ncbi:MAG: hypothetical protein Q8K86_08990 [Candidatus Nanopelagicaceae bacterium]|nr:hypothetical protein [Candidatus Nanopelagicaceae bacterium]
MAVTKADLDKARQKLLNRKGSIKRDPMQWAPRVRDTLPKDGSPMIFRFRILPPMRQDEKVLDGDKSIVVKEEVDWAIEHGSHWFNNRPYECPRLVTKDPCPVCDIGFGLMKTTSDKEKRSAIAKSYLPKSYWAVNVYFLNADPNPDEIRGKVLWADINKTVFDICEQCVMADDQGSDEDPRPFGLFYDVDEGYVFQMDIRSKGGYPTYSMSKFLIKTRGPLAKSNSGERDDERIGSLLGQRHFLPYKIEKPNLDELEKIAGTIADDDVEAEEVAAGTAVDEDNVVEAGTASRPKPIQTKAAEAADDEVAEEAPKTAKKPVIKKPVTDEVVEEAPKAVAKAKPKPKPQPQQEEKEEDPEVQELLDELKAE